MKGLAYIGQDTIESAIQSLRDKGGEFMAAYNRLASDETRFSAYPDLYAQWQSLMSKGDDIKATVSYIASAVDNAGSFLNKTFGLSGMNAVGLFPLIPVAVAVGAVAAISAFMYSYSALEDSLTRRELADKGYSGTDIGAMGGPSIMGDVSMTVKYIALAAFGIIVLPKLMDAMKK